MSLRLSFRLPSIEQATFVHIHIDPVGGIAGDMFIAAMLDLYPHLETAMRDNLRLVKELDEIEIQSLPFDDNVLVGRQFKVSGPGLSHQHSHYTTLAGILTASTMADEVKLKAGDILKRLALAEAVIHGVDLKDVVLHEVGSPDSLADIVCSAFLINAIDAATWSCSALPAGNGTVRTAHGDLPVPAPAVVSLLQGYPIHNDGRQGERVTPTGAAILQSLNPSFDTSRPAMTLAGAGHGFGNTTFTGLSNVLRLTAYQDIDEREKYEKIGVITFEVDDQTPEDLSIGLDRLRAANGVLDVVQIPATGKKGRLTVHVQVLTRFECVDEVAAMCATETATLGVRIATVERLVLERTSEVLKRGGTDILVKVARRPGGEQTAKVEADDLAQVGNFSQRKKVKQVIELEVESAEPASEK